MDKKNTPFSLLSPRPLPAPLDSPHFLLSSGSFDMVLSRANCALKENTCTAGYVTMNYAVLHGYLSVRYLGVKKEIKRLQSSIASFHVSLIVFR